MTARHWYLSACRWHVAREVHEHSHFNETQVNVYITLIIPHSNDIMQDVVRNFQHNECGF